MELTEYVVIQDKFIDRFGHDKAVTLMHDAISWIRASENVDEFDFVYNLSSNQSDSLKNELRRIWIKHAKA